MAVATRVMLVVLCGAFASCSQLVRYTDELVDSSTGRTPVVTYPATAGGFVGFAVGIPADVVALPATALVYQAQRAQNKLKADAISTLLFPSFVLWRAGTLVAVPFDMLEHITYRAWQPPVTRSREEQEAYENELDESTWQVYSVQPIYPSESSPNGS